MDRMIHTALNSVKNMYDQRFRSASNLANVNVPGYRRDMPNEVGSRNLATTDQASARSFSLEMGRAGFSSQSGKLMMTEIATDIAVVGDGYFYVQPPEGAVALTRRGDLFVDGQGRLLNGGEEQVLNTALAPIVVPPYREIQISDVGEVLVSPLAEAPGTFQSLGFIATTQAQGEALFKGLDGRIRRADDTLPDPTGGVKIASAMLEAANVNAVDELVGSLEIQRQFEISIRLMKVAEEIDQGGAQMMRLPEG